MPLKNLMLRLSAWSIEDCGTRLIANTEEVNILTIKEIALDYWGMWDTINY